MKRRDFLSGLTGAGLAAAFSDRCGQSSQLHAGEGDAFADPLRYVAPPHIPDADLSGDVGQRLLRLMSVQAERNLAWMAEERRRAGMGAGEFALPDLAGLRWPDHALYHLCGNAYLMATLALFGEPGRSTAGTTSELLAEAAMALVRTVTDTHPVGGSDRAVPKLWDKHHALRLDHMFGMGAWLLWEKLDDNTRMRVARIIEHDADLFQDDPASARLYDDTQAESNAWTAGGIAFACCLLKTHPHRDRWRERACELMLSAYATPRNVVSDEIVEGRPLREWLRSPNAFDDYMVENHGFVHPDYIAAISEQVRSAICYRLAGEPIPQAVTFNADKVLDALLLLNLPDGNHLYVQGSDYITRRLDSFFQACNIVPLLPTPLRQACFLRSLAALEIMAQERPDMQMWGWLGMPYDLGTVWGLTENYLMRRLFGHGGDALPEDRIEESLAGVHVSEGGRFAIHRTPRTLSTFSWHASRRQPNLMGLTMPLDKDILCAPLPLGRNTYVGQMEEAGVSAVPAQLAWREVRAGEDHFAVVVGVDWCGGKVRQHSAFISLPNGWSVYLEQRIAVQAVTVALAECGSVAVYDDLRWPRQAQPRVFRGPHGPLGPPPAGLLAGNWLNVDDRIGFAALGCEGLRLAKSQEQYHTWVIAFAPTMSGKQEAAGRAWDAGERISDFALVSCPNHCAADTETLATAILEKRWMLREEGALALDIGPYVAYAVFAPRHQSLRCGDRQLELAPHSAGFVRDTTLT